MRNALVIILLSAAARTESGSGSGSGSEYSKCYMSTTEDCSITKLAPDVSTMVYPLASSGARCIFSGDDEAYAFEVVPGKSDKLLIFFQGGGACWDLISTRFGSCTTSLQPDAGSNLGVFNRSDTRNPFRDYTVVQALYCSGDVHGGNVTRNYRDPSGKPVQQHGAANVRAMLDWLAAQKLGAPSDAVAMGDSAGSLGVQIWAATLAGELGASRFAIVPDSYAGVFPPGGLGSLIQGFGFCDTELIDALGGASGEVAAKCVSKELVLQDITSYAMGAYPQVPFAFIQSKADATQISFYLMVGATLDHNASMFITPEEFMLQTDDLFALSYNTAHPNFVVYQVTGSTHTFTMDPWFFSTTTVGSHGGGSQEPLYAWLSRLPLAPGEPIMTLCDGRVLPPGPESQGDGYCDSRLQGKTFSPPSPLLTAGLQRLQ